MISKTITGATSHSGLCDFSVNDILNCSKCPRLSAYTDSFQELF